MNYKKSFYPLMIVLATLINGCVALVYGQEADLLSGRYDEQALAAKLIPPATWTPFPRISDREAWSAADEVLMQAYLKKAETLVDYAWPYIPATKSLLIERTGDRDEYQRLSFAKREALGTLLLAEIYENKGRFVDAIIDGVWSICEESFWGVPAHLPRSPDYNGLMDVSRPFVDLFAAETATYLAWVDYFLGPQLDAISPQLRKRIYKETNDRIFTPLMTQRHGWMGPNENGRPPNNWNPWICSNWLNAVLLLEQDPKVRTRHVVKILEVLDEFVNPYPQDGGCDEGPGYWGAAAASLYDNLSLLNLATDNAYAFVFEDEKIRNMGRFIYRAQISEDYFLNFADADPRPRMAGDMIYRFGRAIQDEQMMQFGAYYHDASDPLQTNFHYFRRFFALFIQDEIRQTEKKLPLPQDAWFPDLQVLVARDQAGSAAGFFMAAKGGHNDESHNHNDVGNYVVYYDGLPLIIDVGRGTYTRKTFSDKRYDIWYNCSDFHNTATLNGKTQPPGASYRAADVRHQVAKTKATFQLNMAGAYPKNSGVTSFNRAITLHRNRSVEVRDQVRLAAPGSITEHLMTCYPAEVTGPGRVTVFAAGKNGMTKDFVIRFPGGKWTASVEKVPLKTMEDGGIRTKWGDTIYRINFVLKAPSAQEVVTFSVEPAR